MDGGDAGAAAPAHFPWILVPAVLAVLTGIVLIVFAALAALATGGLVALRPPSSSRARALRERFARLFGR